jgi:RNA polymerase sigma factor (sigma-70 family)
MTSLPLPNVHDLLADAGWVRSLARSLVRNGHEADDLAQEACLVALQKPPRHGTNVRGWFQQVLGNLVRQGSRAARRRQRREHDVAAMHAGTSGSGTSGSDELFERAAVHRAVVDGVLALEQPYRDTMLLRWFEDQPPRVIAARTHVPVATVHSRLQRGAALLRARLDRRFGSHRAWSAALLPLPLPVGLALSVVGVVVMQSKALAAGAVVVVGTALWLGFGTGSAPDVPRGTETTAPPPPVLAKSAAGEVPPRTDAPARANATPAAANVAQRGAPAAATARAITGRVVDPEGRAVASIDVRLGEALAASDAAGAFTVAAERGQGGKVHSDAPQWRTVMAALVGADSVTPALVVVGPAVDVAGSVRSADGAAVAAAEVRVVWPADLRSRLTDIADTSLEESLDTKSGADGGFTLAAARVRGAELLVVADGFLPHRQTLPSESVAGMRIVLESPTAKPGTIQGQVVDARGAALAGARVGLGGAMVRSDDRGNFLIDDDGKGATLAAAAAGHRRGAVARPAAGFPPFVLVALGGAPLAIRGQVVDATGAGVVGAKVWVTDATLLCRAREPMAVEGLAAGVPTMGELQQAMAARGEQRPTSTPSTAVWPWVATDAGGNFVVAGLEDRPYRLRAMVPETLLRVDADGIAAGSNGVRLVLPTAAVFARVAGTVATRQGTPVAGVRMAVQADPQSFEGFTMHEQALARATSDAEGRFELKLVPHQNVYLRLDGDAILPLEFGRRAAGGLLELAAGRPEDLRLTVTVRMHVQVELIDPAAADSIAVIDDKGRHVNLTVFSGRGRNDSETLELAGGKSPVFVVPDTAATLILRRGDREVRREALQLQLGTVNSLRL